MTFEPRLLADENDRAACVAEIARLQSSTGTVQESQLALLRKLIALYDDDVIRTKAPDAVDAIVHRMRELGLRQADIAPWLGGRNRASEILARKRPLSLSMIRAVSRALQIPVDLLVFGSERETATQPK